MIDSTTQLVGVIGSPVRHSLSPALHNAAFTARDTNWVYLAFEVRAGSGRSALEAMRALGIRGLSVTMPLKEEICDALGRVDPAARALRSVNTVWRDETGELVGSSTDGEGFVASVQHDAAVDPSGLSVVVLGAGAAARSVIDALARAGAGDIAVVNRTADRAVEAAALAPGVARVGTPGDVATADLLVNATSLGMGTDELPIDRSVLHEGLLVADLVYHPLQTALLRAAAERGARTLDGLGMLVHQAALQQVLWTGDHPDVAAMRAAAMAELDRRQRTSA